MQEGVMMQDSKRTAEPSVQQNYHRDGYHTLHQALMIKVHSD
jgi:hypothetical protein